MIPSYRIDHLRKILGHLYDFEAFLGRGAFADVLRVRHRRLGRREALKILLEAHDGASNFATRFVKEAKLVASLDHPNIVKVYDYGEIEGVLWYSMQYVDGVTLRAEIDHRPIFSEQEVVSVAVPLLDALENSHGAGIVHRDVKPSIIMISRRGRPYLMDFGIAKVKDSGLRTQTGSVLGTPAYISPEQASGEPVDGRSDVYSLACCLYQLLTGHLPFPGDDPIQMLLRRLKGDPLPPSKHRPEIAPELEAVILQALQKSPDDRFQSAAAMRRQLTERFRPKVETQAIHLTVDMEPPQVLPPMDPTIATDTWPQGTDLKAAAAASRALELTEAPTLITESPAMGPQEASVPSETTTARRSGWIIGLLACIILVLAGALTWQGLQDRADGVGTIAPPMTQNAEGRGDDNPTTHTDPEAAEPHTSTSPSPPVESPQTDPTSQDIEEGTAPPVETADAVPSSVRAAEPPTDSAPTKTPSAPTTSAAGTDTTELQQPSPAPSLAVRPAVHPPKLLERALLEEEESLRDVCGGRMVILTVHLDEHGKVTSTRILKSPGPQCSDLAVDVAKRSRFQPGRDFEERPTASSLSLSLRFHLR